MPIRSKPFLSLLVEDLKDPDEATAYLRAAWEDSDEMFLVAFLDVAQAHEVATVARKSGTTRENLYRAFSEHGNPTLKTLSAALRAAGLKLDVRPIDEGTPTVSPSGIPQQKIGAPKPRRRRALLAKHVGQMKFAFAIEPENAGAAPIPAVVERQSLGVPINPLRRASWAASTLALGQVFRQNSGSSWPPLPIAPQQAQYRAVN